MSTPTRRRVSAHMELIVGDQADLAASFAVASSHDDVDETLEVSIDDQPLSPREIVGAHGGRLHLLRAVVPGRLVIDYVASVNGTATIEPVSELDRYRYVRPSRYCESDRLGPLARTEFAGLDGRELLDAVSSWVGDRIAYVPGSSRAIDGAVETVLARSGVCRDFAHLTAALLRATGTPARVASVYAPGLDPMDFHAVTEASVDGAWYVVDPTCRAPRSSLLRIATGADAADTAFLTIGRGRVDLDGMTITAAAEPTLPTDDLTTLVQLC